jgi:hypothetical protein
MAGTSAARRANNEADGQTGPRRIEEQAMKRYTPTRLAPAFALGSAALTAGVMTLAVYLPATSAPVAAQAAERVEVAIEPARIDVVGVRRPATRAHVNEASTPAG